MKRRKLFKTNNTGAMADVAFLLLIFFMVVTTFNKDYKLAMTLPRHTENPSAAPISKDRIISISINATNELMIENNITVIDPTSDIFMGLKPILNRDQKPVIVIKMHPDTDYQAYIEVLAHIKQAKETLRLYLSQHLLQKKYRDLDINDKQAIENRLQMTISEQEMKIS